MTVYSVLDTLCGEIEQIDFVRTVKIGIEPNLSPEDYPMVRVVPQRLTPSAPYNQRLIEVGIYFGANTLSSDGMEKVYDDLFYLEEEIIKVVKALGGKYFETITDEDRLDTYKLMYIRADMYAERPESA